MDNLRIHKAESIAPGLDQEKDIIADLKVVDAHTSCVPLLLPTDSDILRRVEIG